MSGRLVPFGHFLIGYDDDGPIEKTAPEMTRAELAEAGRRLDAEVENIKVWAVAGAPCAPHAYAKARNRADHLARFAAAIPEAAP